MIFNASISEYEVNLQIPLFASQKTMIMHFFLRISGFWRMSFQYINNCWEKTQWTLNSVEIVIWGTYLIIFIFQSQIWFVYIFYYICSNYFFSSDNISPRYGFKVFTDIEKGVTQGCGNIIFLGKINKKYWNSFHIVI